MTITQYLGVGAVSRGRMTITRRLDTFVSLPPYLHDDFDKEAIIKGIENVQAILNKVSNLTWITPTPNITVAAFVNSLPATPSKRRANHWLGEILPVLFPLCPSLLVVFPLSLSPFVHLVRMTNTIFSY